MRAFPSCEEELSPLLDALRELSEEDPLLGLEWNREKREIYLRITGKIQLEILSERLAGRYRLHANFSAPSVIYKETPAAPGEGSERYTMPKPCWACLTLRMEPLPRGSGIVYRSVIKEKELPYRYQHHVETSVRETLAQGIHGWEVTDAAITLTAGEHHPIHTHPLDFFVATPVAFLRALTACGSRLLEPLVQVRLTAGEAHLGRVIGDILAMRGEFDSPVVTRDTFTLEAVLPGGHLPGLSGDLPLPDLRQGQLFLPVCRIPRVSAGLRGGYAPPGRGSPGSRPLDPSRPQRDVSQTWR